MANSSNQGGDTTKNQTVMLEAGRVIHNKWEILGFIAKGGKGEVYLAKQINLDRRVALKIMSQEFVESLRGRDEEYESELQRFRREVQVMAKIRHPNVIQIFDFDQVEIGGQSLDYIVMEYIEGTTLRPTMPDLGFGSSGGAIADWLRKYFLPILDGMQAVHDQGVVHRDMKPENVLLDGGVPKIADFGLAGGHNLGEITRSFHIIGTPPYMPEEQFMELATTDARTDVYALGKILYEAIEGKMTQERDKPFNSVRLSDPQTRMQKRLDKLIRSATARNRDDRLSTVKAMRDEIVSMIGESDEGRQKIKAYRQKTQIIFMGVFAGLMVLVVGFFLLNHFFFETKPGPDGAVQPQVGRAALSILPSGAVQFEFATSNPTSIPRVGGDGDLPDSIFGSDVMIMRHVPGGEVTVAMEQPGTPDRRKVEKVMQVAGFYMDETKINNTLFVEFLHELEGLEVREQAVWRDGRLWLLLGEVYEGYEPIVYREGKFRITPGTESNPVVQVTPIGALAYARYHGRDLPTMAQWTRAIQAGRDEAPADVAEPAQEPPSHMHGLPQPQAQTLETTGIGGAATTPPNNLGIRGLGQNVNEWTIALTDDGQVEFHIHGGIGEEGHEKSYLIRRPWEAFSSVGFRTVLNLPPAEQ